VSSWERLRESALGPQHPRELYGLFDPPFYLRYSCMRSAFHCSELTLAAWRAAQRFRTLRASFFISIQFDTKIHVIGLRQMMLWVAVHSYFHETLAHMIPARSILFGNLPHF